MGIVDFIVLLGIGVSLYRHRGRNLEWLRRRLATQSRSIVRRLPGIVAQCLEDVRSCQRDLMGLLSPKTQRRIEDRARTLFAKRLQTPGN